VKSATRRAALGLGAGCAFAAGCGGIKAPDLFLVERSGTVAGARLTLLVNEEGGVTCNGRVARKLEDPQLIEARALEEELRPYASRHLVLAPGPRSVLHYHLREQSGSVSFSDDSRAQPTVLRRLQLFVVRAAQRACGLPM
jgi:hypothetical protein